MKIFRVNIWEDQIISSLRILDVEAESEKHLKKMIKEANTNNDFEHSIVEWVDVVEHHYSEPPESWDKWETETAEINEESV